MIGDHIYYSGKYEELVTAISNIDFTDFRGVQRTNERVSPAMTFASPEYIYTSYINRGDEQVYTARIRLDQTEFETVQQTNSFGMKHRIYPQVVEDRIYYTYMHEHDGWWQVHTSETDLDLMGWQEVQKTYFSAVNSYPYVPTIETGHVRFQVTGDKIYYTWAYYDVDGYLQIWTAEMNKDGTDWVATKRTDTPVDKWRPEIKVVGSKIYLIWWEGSRSWTGGPLYTGTIGCNIVAKSSSYGLGMDENRTISGYINNQPYLTQTGNSAGASVFGGTNPGWNYVAVTYDRSKVKLFLNGEIVSERPFTDAVRNNPFSLRIGDDFQGTIDEVRISDRALSILEIRERYDTMIGGQDILSPVLLSPSNQAVLTDNFPEFSWTSSAGPNGTYTIECALDSNFTQLVERQSGLTGNTFISSSPLQNGTKYYWHVEAVSSDGIHSGYQTQPFSFTIVAGGAIPQTGWNLYYVDTEEIVSADQAAQYAFDGDPNTFWHSEWIMNNPDSVHPHEIQIDLGADYYLNGFRYLPRQDRSNGRIKDYEFYVSTDGMNWGTPVASGTFPNTAAEQEVLFPVTVGSYIRLVALTEVYDRPWTTVAEINVLGNDIVLDSDGDGYPDSSDNCPAVPNDQTDSDADGVGDACDLCPNDPGKTDPGLCGCGTADTDTDGDGTPDLCGDQCPTDPDKTLPGVCGCGTPDIDSDGDGTLDCNDNCPFDPNKVDAGICGCGVADIDTDTDSDGLVDCIDPCPYDPENDADGDGVCGIVLPQTGWNLYYVDTEEIVSADQAAQYAFDGDPNTFWHSEWIMNNPDSVHPHEIQIDLGADYYLNGFRYLPRQDRSNGRIKDYEFYVSTDGMNWGTPVASGTFPNTAAEQEVLFPVTVGSYIRLVALTEVYDRPWTTVAEINVLGNAVLQENN